MTRKRILIVLTVAAVLLIGGGIVALAHTLRDSEGHQPATVNVSPSGSAAPSLPSARAQAFRTAAAFCQPDQTKDTWQRNLSPYLTVDAWRLFQATVPANVPCAGVVDDPQPVGDQQTPTDQAYVLNAATGGPVTVTLHRDSTAGPWLATYISPGGQP